MIKAFENIIKRTFLYRIFNYVKLRNWENKGKLFPPPPLLKQRTIMEYAKRFSIHILIETGTYFGDTVYETRDKFSRIFSIELDKSLYEKAKKRFSKFDHISILHGNSGVVLPLILADITQPCLFWLDSHYSGGITAKSDLNTPIKEELKRIFAHPIKEHVILIDDAREFTGRNDYPTIEELKEFILMERPDWIFEVKHDIIRIHR